MAGFLLDSGPCLSNQAKGAYIQMRNTHEAQPQQDGVATISHVNHPPLPYKKEVMYGTSNVMSVMSFLTCSYLRLKIADLLPEI